MTFICYNGNSVFGKVNMIANKTLTPEEIRGLPRSRQDALILGEKHYFTGKACCRRHYAPRSVSNGRCIRCDEIVRTALKEAGKEWGRKDINTMSIMEGLENVPPTFAMLRTRIYLLADCVSNRDRLVQAVNALARFAVEFGIDDLETLANVAKDLTPEWVELPKKVARRYRGKKKDKITKVPV